MKKYLLFAGPNYYPSGGLDDLVKSFDSIEEAKAFAEADHEETYEWAQIVETKSLKLVLCGDIERAFRNPPQDWNWDEPDE